MPTSPPSSAVSPGGRTASRRRNNNHVADAYLDLMKPDEQLTDQQDTTERRKIQNRLAQRAYRRNMRDRNIEVKMLREELERMREAAGQGSDTAAATQAGSPSSNAAVVQANQQDKPSSSAGTPSTVPGSASRTEAFTARIPGPDFMAACHFDTYQDNWILPSSSDSPSALFNEALFDEALTIPPSSFQVSSSQVDSAPTTYRAWPFSALPSNTRRRPFGGEAEYPSPPYEDNNSTHRISSPHGHPSITSSHIPDAREPLVHIAVASGHLETLRYLLAQSHVSSNVRDSAGYTPLQRAVAMGRIDMVTVLLKAGASIGGFEDGSQNFESDGQ